MSRERYQLGVILRFCELESQVGRQPRKILHQSLRKSISQSGCLMDDEPTEMGTRESPRVTVRPEVLSPSARGIGLAEPPTSAEKVEDVNFDPRRRLRSIFSSNNTRQVDFDPGWDRRERRAAREREYASRRLRENRELAAVAQERFIRVPGPDQQSRLDRTMNQVRRFEDSVVSEDTPLRYPQREIPPPPALIVPNGRLTPPRGRGRRRGAGRIILRREQESFSSQMDASSNSSGLCRTFGCSKPFQHMGRHGAAGTDCPECRAPLGTRHTEGCKVREERARGRGPALLSREPG